MSVDVNFQALVLSTTPHFPRDYGNRNRIHQMIEFLKSLGYKITFVLYPFDEDWARNVPPYYKELANAFDYFTVVPNSRKLHQNASGFHHTIDEWWDENIGETLRWLFDRKKFDVFVVNYTFLSRAFTYAPPGVAKILETHDCFSGRRETFEAHGAEPEFFYTNPDEERIAFDRADVVIAIKDAEAEAISAMTSTRVITIPYWDGSVAARDPPTRAEPLKFDHDRPLRLGFIGAQNSVNIVNMRRFLERFSRWMRLYNPPIRLVVAGNACRGLPDGHAFLDKLGRVEAIGDFYDQVDAIVAPLEFSTGIKIKVGEALAWGKPVIATHNAFDGYRVWHRSQSLESVEALCEQLIALAANEEPWEDLVRDAHRAGESAKEARDAGFANLQGWLRERAQRIVVVAARPFWDRKTLVDEQTAQAIEYVSHLAKVMVIVTAPGPVDPSRVYAAIDWIPVGTGEIEEAFAKIAAVTMLVGVVFAPGASSSAAPLAPTGTPVWRLETLWRGPADPLGRSRLVALADGETLPISSLRYRPDAADKTIDRTRVLIVVAESMGEWEETLIDYIRIRAELLAMTSVTLRVSPGFIDDSDFYTGVVSSRAKRVILVGDGEWIRFIAQIAYYRGVSCMVAARDLLAPCVVDEDGLPSLVDSVDGFLLGNSAASTASHADSGWDEVWRRLSNHMRSAPAG